MNPDEREQALQDIARRQLILSHRLATWYTYAQANPDSEPTQTAARLAELEARQLLEAVQEATDIDG